MHCHLNRNQSKNRTFPRLYKVTRVKNAVRMRAFPNRNYTRYQNKRDSGREIQKSKLHTQKISLEFHEHKVY